MSNILLFYPHQLGSKNLPSRRRINLMHGNFSVFFLSAAITNIFFSAIAINFVMRLYDQMMRGNINRP